jgi:hypothetical protein
MATFTSKSSRPTSSISFNRVVSQIKSNVGDLTTVYGIK